MDRQHLLGMIANCPWGDPLSTWTVSQLQRGRDHCASADGDSPMALAAINRELRNRPRP